MLKAAVEGRLTQDWREQHPDVEPASELLERILAERRRKWEAENLAEYEAKGKKPPKNWQDKYADPATIDANSLPDIPDRWCWAPLEALAEIVGGITVDRKRESQPGVESVPYLRVANVQRGYLDLSEIKNIFALPSDIAKLRLEMGDVLFTEGGDRDKLGRGWIWSGEIDCCVHQNHVFRARFHLREMQPRFVSHHGNTFGKEWFIKAGKQTTNLASINLGILRRFPVAVPPAEEQAVIVSLLDAELSLMNAVESSIRHALQRASHLRQSILQRAFQGRLVPQDPDDEPAATLLERIKREREQASEQPSKIKGGGKKKMAQTQRSLRDVLQEHPDGLSPEDLLKESGRTLEHIERFYRDLREISDDIEEIRPEGEFTNQWPLAAQVTLKLRST